MASIRESYQIVRISVLINKITSQKFLALFYATNKLQIENLFSVHNIATAYCINKEHTASQFQLKNYIFDHVYTFCQMTISLSFTHYLAGNLRLIDSQ